jgi:hypothetical protein
VRQNNRAPGLQPRAQHMLAFLAKGLIANAGDLV